MLSKLFGRLRKIRIFLKTVFIVYKVIKWQLGHPTDRVPSLKPLDTTFRQDIFNFSLFALLNRHNITLIFVSTIRYKVQPHHWQTNHLYFILGIIVWYQPLLLDVTGYYLTNLVELCTMNIIVSYKIALSRMKLGLNIIPCLVTLLFTPRARIVGGKLSSDYSI